MLKRIVIGMAGLALVTGCATSSVNQKAKQATDTLLAQYAAVQRTEAAPDAYEPMQWQAGQWLVYKSVDTRNQQTSVTKISVLEQSDEGIWLETETWSYQNHSIAKVLYERAPTQADEAMDIVKKMITKTDDAAPQEMDFTQPNPMMDMMKGMMKQYLQGATTPENINLDGKADVTVAAGTFIATGQYSSSMSYPGGSTSLTFWFHPAVPINGMVKGVSTDGQLEMELLDYGTTGAKSAL